MEHAFGLKFRSTGGWHESLDVHGVQSCLGLAVTRRKPAEPSKVFTCHLAVRQSPELSIFQQDDMPEIVIIGP